MFDQIGGGGMDWRNDIDRAYANAAFISGGAEVPARWAAQAAAFRAGGRGLVDVPYGGAKGEQFDLFLPDAAPRGLLVFVHGGYWMALGRGDFSHLAAGALARGWACALPSYTLAPQARVSTMVAQIGQAVAVAAGRVAGPVVVAGHSAGGHLAARLGCADLAATLPGAVAARLVRVVPISPLADLAPLMQTAMNATLHLDAAECAAQSPARHARRAGCTAHVWVGGEERPAFLWQARLLAEEWDCPWTVEAGRHHFDVIDGLADPASALMRACLDGL